MRLTTLLRAGSFGRSIFSPFCFLRSNNKAHKTRLGSLQTLDFALVLGDLGE